MPRKIRELKAELRREGFIELTTRGKGSHTMWQHPKRNHKLTVPGRDGDDAAPWLETAVRRALAEVRADNNPAN